MGSRPTSKYSLKVSSSSSWKALLGSDMPHLSYIYRLEVRLGVSRTSVTEKEVLLIPTSTQQQPSRDRSCLGGLSMSKSRPTPKPCRGMNPLNRSSRLWPIAQLIRKMSSLPSKPVRLVLFDVFGKSQASQPASKLTMRRHPLYTPYTDT
jgi:hypothetical protein